MASWDGAEQGAMAAAPTGNPWLIAAGALLGGLFGHREHYTPAQKQQQRIANQMEQFGNSVPLSDPLEQAALAESRGMLGESQRQDMGALMSLSPNFASTGAGGAADQVRSMRAGQTGQSMALSSQALLNAIASRRRALMEAAQVAQGVGQPRQVPGLGEDLANLMRVYSQYQAQRNQQGQGGSGQSTGASSYTPPSQGWPGIGGPGTSPMFPVDPEFTPQPQGMPGIGGPGTGYDYGGGGVSAQGIPPGILGNGGANFLTGGAGQITPQAPQGARWGMPTSNGSPNSDVFKTPPNPFFNPQQPQNPWSQMMNMANRPRGGMGANVFSDMFNQQAAGGNSNNFQTLLQGFGR